MTTLTQLRLGCVAYLNSAPLIHGAESHFALEHPADLARKMAADELDGGLAPLFALLEPARYVLVDGVGICAEGPVYSVGVIAAAPLEDLAEVALTEASRSSRNLLKVLYAEFLPRVRPAFTEAILPEHDAPDWPDRLDAELARCRDEPRGLLLIGDRALAAHRNLDGIAGGDLRFIDLGAEWQRHTGLPFVFAMWGLRAGLAPALQAAVADELRALAAHGLAHRPEIAARYPPADSALAYLHTIRYQVGKPHHQGLEEYLRLLKKHALLPKTAGLPRFV